MTKNLLQAWLKALFTDRVYIVLSYCVVGVVLTATVVGLEIGGVSRTLTTAVVFLSILPLQFAVFLLQRNKFAEPFWIAQGVGKYARLRFEREFKEDIAEWPDGTLSTVYFGCEVLLRQNRKDLLQQHRAELMRFIVSCYDPATGFHRRNINDGTGSPYYSYCATGIVKSLHGVTCAEAIDILRVESMLRENARSLVFAAAARAKAILSGDDFPDQHRTVVDLYACYGILRNLQEAGRLEGSRDDLRVFLRSVMVDDGATTAFRIAPEYEEPCMNATDLALSLLKIAGVKPNELIDQESVRQFIESCWHEEGGFSSIPTSDPTVVHTKMALDVLRLLGDAPDEQRVVKLIRFLKSCKAEQAFAFRPGMLPNAFAARCALDIVDRLKDFGCEPERLQDLRFDLRFDWLPQTFVTDFYNPATGGFRGYSTWSPSKRQSGERPAIAA